MGLLPKFTLLVSLLCAAVAANIAATAWSIRFLERELSWPLASMQATLERMHDIRVDLRRLERSGRVGELTPDAVRAVMDRASRAFTALEFESQIRMTVGTATSQNLGRRLDRTASLGERWGSGESPARAELVLSLGETTSLIERIEARVIAESDFAVDFGDRLRGRVFSMILISAALTLCTIGLSAFFVRRWVLSPIERIRLGAERFGLGELDHRISVGGRDELAALSADLNEMAAMIRALQDQRIERERLAAMGEMLRRVVHNLRTPLSGIRALAESSREDAPPESDIPMMQDRIIASVDRFEQWLRELLSVSSPLYVELLTEPVSAWVKALVEARRDAAGAKGVELRVVIEDGAPRTAEFDAAQLAHAGSAVLDNAIEASDPGGEVCVRAAGLDDCRWLLEFSDDGPGIAREHLEQIFRPYFSTKPRGTGIGLAMTRSIVEAHGGRIVVGGRESGMDDPRGAEIRFELPLGSRQPLPEPRE